MQILIDNGQKAIRLDIKKIGLLAKKIWKIVGLPSKGSLGIIFLSRARIKQLNRRYFKRDRVTDVIAFGYRQTRGPFRIQRRDYAEAHNRIIKRGRPASLRRGGPHHDYIGDIAICPSVAVENSRVYRSDFYTELALYIIHGILHLQGYADTTEQKRLRMQKKEEEILARV